MKQLAARSAASVIPAQAGSRGYVLGFLNSLRWVPAFAWDEREIRAFAHPTLAANS